MLALLLLVGCGSRPDGVYSVVVQDVDLDVACQTNWMVEPEDYENIDAIFVEVSMNRMSMLLDFDIACDSDGRSFDCSHLTQDSAHGYDMESENLTDVEGEWTSPVGFESDWSLLATCTGADCGSYSESCTITWSTTAEFDRDATRHREATIRRLEKL